MLACGRSIATGIPVRLLSVKPDHAWSSVSAAGNSLIRPCICDMSRPSCCFTRVESMATDTTFVL